VSHSLEPPRTSANAARRDTAGDRECLRGKVTQLLYALVKHDM
jgi:hypothetical protein